MTRIDLRVLLLLFLILAVAFTSEAASGMTQAAGFDSGKAGPELVLAGDENANRIQVQLLGRQDYRVLDTAGVLVTGVCTNSGASEARCPRTGPNLRAGLADGNDRLSLSGNLLRSIVDGGGGDDRIGGSGGRNVAYGKTGDDKLFGAAGRDFLYGEGGRDRLSGGSDSDTLYAHDGQADGKIDCGPGRDVAYIDRALDPATSHCETVRFTETGNR